MQERRPTPPPDVADRPKPAAASAIALPRGPSPWRRVAAAVVVAVLALAAAWWAWGRGAEVKTVSPVVGDAAEVVYATGIVEPVTWAKVSALQRKRIVELCHCEGRRVKKGDVLARLDDSAERAVLRELEARLERVKEEAERLKILLTRNATTRTGYEEKLTQVREYEARVAAQKDRIDDLALKSPIDGIVLRRDGEVGEMAGTGANDVLLWVGQPKPLQVVAEVNEDDILKVTPGQKSLLRHEGSTGTPLTATVDRITPKGDPQTKTFRVYLTLPDDTPLKIGMSVEANIIVREAKGALLLPAEAIADNAVQVVANGRIERRTVKVGIRGTRMVEITDGVKMGDVVVSPARPELTAGARVRLAPKSAAPSK